MNIFNKDELQEIFKEIYKEEFEDPNESFMDFLLDLIPKNKLIKTIERGKRYYYSLFGKYK